MKADIERNYTIPLRKRFVIVPKYYRSKRAINQIKEFIKKHMKTEDVRIGKELNEYVWKHGIKNPPGKVKVKAMKYVDYVTVELEGHDYKTEKIQTEKTETPKNLKEKLASKVKSLKTTDTEETDVETKADVKTDVKETNVKKTETKKADVKTDVKTDVKETKPKAVEKKPETTKTETTKK